ESSEPPRLSHSPHSASQRPRSQPSTLAAMVIACQCRASIGHNRFKPAGIRRGRHTTGADLHRYAPRTALDWLAADPGLRHRPVDGTLAFFDVSGFTRLSERLGRAGKIGTETLSAIIDGLYGGMIDPVLGG